MSEHSHHIEVKLGSEKNFGLVFALVFLIVALFPLLGEGSVRYIPLGISAALAVLAFVFPPVFRIPNKLWFRFGLLLGSIMTPVVMGVVYFTTIVPMGLVMKMRGKDLLNTKLDPERKSYWHERTPDDMQSMKNQF